MTASPSPSPSQFDDGRATYSGDYTVELIVNFVLTEQLPLITKFSDQTAPKIFGGKIKTHLLSFFPDEDENTEAILKELMVVAKEFKGQVGAVLCGGGGVGVGVCVCGVCVCKYCGGTYSIFICGQSWPCGSVVL